MFEAKTVEENEAIHPILVVGHGRWGEQYARRLSEQGALAGIVVRSQESAEQCRLRYQRPALCDLGQALDTLKPQGVAVLSPTCWHVAHAVEAMNRKIPVMVIKPVAARVGGALRLKQAIETHKTPYFSAHEMVWMPAIERIKKTVEAGTIGALTLVRSFQQGSFHGDNPPPPMEHEQPGENLAFLYDSTMHEMAVLNHLADAAPTSVEVKEVYASVARPEILAHIDYGAGVKGQLEYRGDPELPKIFSFSVEGELGSVTFEARSEETRCTLQLGERTEALSLEVERPSHPIDAVIGHFEKVIAGATPAEGLPEGISAIRGAELLCRAAADRANLEFIDGDVLGPKDLS